MDRKRVLVATLIAVIVVVTAVIFLCKSYRLLDQPRTLNVKGQISGSPLMPVPASDRAVDNNQSADDTVTVPIDENEREFARYEDFPEVRTVSGEYSKQISGPVEIGHTENLVFDLGISGKNQVPQKIGVYPRNFIFTNNDAAEAAFGVEKYKYDEANLGMGDYCFVTGKATIEISDYYIDHLQGEVLHNGAVFKKVIKKSPPLVTCESNDFD